MFAMEDALVRYLWLLGAGSLVLSALITWAVARRYGRRRALVVPVIALAAVGVMVWRATGLGGQEAMAVTASALVFAGPAVAGGILGLMLSGRGRG